MPDGAARARLGLPEGVPLLLCPQSLFKIHPDNDALFARVLAAAPRRGSSCSRAGIPRSPPGIARASPALRARGRSVATSALIVLPQCGHDDYLRINAVCDAMLDTLRWSGGNTSLDALAAGCRSSRFPGASCAAGRAPACWRLPGSAI